MSEVRHPVFARLYTAFSPIVDATLGVGEHRDELLAGLAGRVVEIGCGNGRNFSHYPDTVTEVVGVEPEPYLRARAQQAAARSRVPIRVADGLAEDLPLGDASFDAGVTSLMLCSVRDPDRALAELRRVIRPGGELRFYEHVVAESPRAARAQRAIDVAWPVFAGGCHTARDTVAAVERAGFAVEHLRRFEFRPTMLTWPISPHVIGRARRPEERRI